MEIKSLYTLCVWIVFENENREKKSLLLKSNPILIRILIYHFYVVLCFPPFSFFWTKKHPLGIRAFQVLVQYLQMSFLWGLYWQCLNLEFSTKVGGCGRKKWVYLELVSGGIY